MFKSPYLDEPITQKLSQSGENEFIVYGVSEMQGWRNTQEDAFNCVLNFDNSSSLFAVYDGHGGSEISRFASDNLPKCIKQSPHWVEGDVERSLVDAFLTFDQSLLSENVNEELLRIRRGSGSSTVPISIDSTGQRSGKVVVKKDTNVHSDCNLNAWAHVNPSALSDSCAKNSMNTIPKSAKNSVNNCVKKRSINANNVCSNTVNSPKDGYCISTSYTTCNINDTPICDKLPHNKPTNADAIVDTVIRDNEMPGFYSGSTSCLLLLKRRVAYVANVGDSRCVLCRGSGLALDLSTDHKPEEPAERRRIERAGGFIDAENRVNGILNMSRCLGDHGGKQNRSLPSDQQIVTAYPDVRMERLEPNDRFIVVACDGIWNSLSSQELVDLVSQRLSKGLTPVQVCEEVCDICMSDVCNGTDDRGCDNMTIIIVKFKT